MLPICSSGRIDLAEWSPTGSRLACFTKWRAVINVFDTSDWSPATTILLPDLLQWSMALAYTSTDLVHVSIRSDLAARCTIVMCRLHEQERDSVSKPDSLPLDLYTPYSGHAFQPQHAVPLAKPQSSPDGLYLAIVDLDTLHVIHARTRSIVCSRRLESPVDSTWWGPMPVHCNISQATWLPHSNTVMVVTGYLLADYRPVLYHLNFVHF